MAPPAPARRKALLVLGGFLAACFSVSAVGGWVTSQSVATWYPTLVKPSFNPPDWVFAPIWTAIYAMMAVAGWRVWRHAGFGGARSALILFGVQLALNLGWSVLFFGLRSPGAALVEIALLWLAIAATGAAFWRLDRWAGLLFVPYLAWTSFAAVLNGAIWFRN